MSKTESQNTERVNHIIGVLEQMDSGTKAVMVGIFLAYELKMRGREPRAIASEMATADEANGDGWFERKKPAITQLCRRFVVEKEGGQPVTDESLPKAITDFILENNKGKVIKFQKRADNTPHNTGGINVQ